jgi:hypothetical protein
MIRTVFKAILPSKDHVRKAVVRRTVCNIVFDLTTEIKNQTKEK